MRKKGIWIEASKTANGTLETVRKDGKVISSRILKHNPEAPTFANFHQWLVQKQILKHD